LTSENEKLIAHLKIQQKILLCASQLSKQIEISEIFNIIQKTLVDSIGVETFSIHIKDDLHNMKMAFSYGLSEDRENYLKKENFFIKNLANSGITIYTKGSNVEELGHSFEIEEENEQFFPEVAITLRNTTAMIGIICIYSMKEKKGVNENDIQFFSMLSSQIAPALESAKIHKIKMSLLKRKLLEKEAENLKVLNKKLENTNKKLNEFVAIVAHDLRNPLGVITGYISILEKMYINKGNYDEKEKKIFNQLNSMCDLSLSLIRDILELGALESGKLVMNMKETPIANLLNEAYENVIFFAQKKDIKILKNINSTKKAHVDIQRIIQVITNLLTNAVKFTPRQGTIELNLYENEKDKKIIIEVKDNGKGISKKIIDNIFDKEVTTSTPGTEGEKGTGFGLPFCQDLVKEHESIIIVESEIGKGTRFYFEISY
jgi:signal transduction histidine kinase